MPTKQAQYLAGRAFSSSQVVCWESDSVFQTPGAQTPIFTVTAGGTCPGPSEETPRSLWSTCQNPSVQLSLSSLSVGQLCEPGPALSPATPGSAGAPVHATRCRTVHLAECRQQERALTAERTVGQGAPPAGASVLTATLVRLAQRGCRRRSRTVPFLWNLRHLPGSLGDTIISIRGVEVEPSLF